MQRELLGQLGTGSAVPWEHPGPAPVTMGQKVPRARGLDTSCSGTGPGRSVLHSTSSSFPLGFEGFFRLIQIKLESKAILFLQGGHWSQE